MCPYCEAAPARLRRYCSRTCWQLADREYEKFRRRHADLLTVPALPFPNYRRELQTAMTQKRDYDHRTAPAPRCD